MASFNRIFTGLTDYPLLIFICMNNYPRGTATYIEKLDILDSWYSHLRAYLPIKFEKKKDEYNADIAGIMIQAGADIDALFKNYDPIYENPDTINPAERDFIYQMRGVHQILDEITAMSKVISGIKMDEQLEV